MKSYLTGVVCAGILCACVIPLFRNTDTHGKLIRTICGLFMLITVIAPITKVSGLSVDTYLDAVSDDSAYIVEDGTQQAQEFLQAFIKEECETYIVEKANGMGVNIDAEVTLSTIDSQTPYSIRISGAVSPYVKAKLQTVIADDLGIPKERQSWT